MIVLADLVMPYNVAFKLIVGVGAAHLAVATWFFARSMKLRFPGPRCVALATVPFMFDRTFTIYGGNIASTLAGEFAISISLSFCLVFLGLFARVLDTGKYKALYRGVAGVPSALVTSSRRSSPSLARCPVGDDAAQASR